MIKHRKEPVNIEANNDIAEALEVVSISKGDSQMENTHPRLPLRNGDDRPRIKMKNNTLQIVTWNSCLGLFGKFDYIKTYLAENGPDILFIQEAELTAKIDPSYLQVRNYNLHYAPPTKLKPG